MKEKNIRMLVVLGLLIVAVFATVMPAVAVNSELHTSIFTGETIVVAPEPWPEQQAVVFYWPQEEGTRTVTIHHRIYFDPRNDPTGIGNVKFYWKDMAVSNDQWHYWTIKDFGFLYPNAKTTLYSGSNTIAYQFVITHYSDFTLPIFVHVY